MYSLAKPKYFLRKWKPKNFKKVVNTYYEQTHFDC